MELSEVLSLGFYESYELLLTIREEYDIPDDLIHKIRFGFNIKFDLYNYINDNFKTKPKEGFLIIENKTCSLTDFLTEIESRKILTKKLLIENLTDNDILTPRK